MNKCKSISVCPIFNYDLQQFLYEKFNCRSLKNINNQE